MRIITGITTKNEDWIIEKTLGVVTKFSHKVIILDDSSSDKTIEICKKFSNVYIYHRKPRKNIWERKESDGLKELFEYVSRENPDYILFLDADEIPTPDILEYIKKLDFSNEYYSVRMINLWRDEDSYRVDNFVTKNGTKVINDPFKDEGWRKTVLMKYDAKFNYLYDEVEKGGTSKNHPLPKIIQGKKMFIEDFYLIHYGKLSPRFKSGEKNKFYSMIEAKGDKKLYEKRLKHHEDCRLGGSPIYKTTPKNWFWV